MGSRKVSQAGCITPSFGVRQPRLNKPDEPPGYVELSYEGVDGIDVEGKGSDTFVKEDDRWKIKREWFSPRGAKHNKAIKGTP